jgi:hypothetical protein
MPPAVLVVVAQAESNEPLQQSRWTCIPGTELSPKIWDPPTVTVGIWCENAQQQHHEWEMPPAVLVVVARAESNQPLQQCRWTCIPGTELSPKIWKPTTVTVGIWCENAQQQHHEWEMPPAVLVVVARAESIQPLQQCRWTCIPGKELSPKIWDPTTVTVGIW